MPEKMSNARAVRFHPYIDVDVDKTTLLVKRVDVDFSDTVQTEMWDYDTEQDLDLGLDGDDPLYNAGLAAVDTVIIPALRRALRDAANNKLGAAYSDYGPTDVPDRSERTVWRITALDLDEQVGRELTEDELWRFGEHFDNSTVNECVEGMLGQIIGDRWNDDDQEDVDEVDASPTGSRCDTCGAPCDDEGCTKDRTHNVAIP